MREAILIRRERTDRQWRRIEGLAAGKEGDRGRSGDDNRLLVDAVLWSAAAEAPWRDLPDDFGKWNSVFTRFRRWAKNGVWARIFKVWVVYPDCRSLFLVA